MFLQMRHLCRTRRQHQHPIHSPIHPHSVPHCLLIKREGFLRQSPLCGSRHDGFCFLPCRQFVVVVVGISLSLCVLPSLTPCADVCGICAGNDVFLNIHMARILYMCALALLRGGALCTSVLAFQLKTPRRKDFSLWNN